MTTRKETAIHELAVVGGGVAGAACALRAAQYHLPTVWILGDRTTAKASRSRWVLNVDNMIGVHPGIVLDKLRKAWHDRPELLGPLEEASHIHIGTQDIVDNVHARVDQYGEIVTRVTARATGGRRQTDGFELELSDAKHPRVRARSVIVATGVMDRQPLIAREKGGRLLDSTHWIYPFANRESVLYCIRCEGHLTRRKRVAVIGASETAAQIALMFAERYDSACCLLANGEEPTVEARTQRLLDHHGIPTHPARLIEVLDDPSSPTGTLRGFLLADGNRVESDFGLVALGLFRVYNELARELGAALVAEDAPDTRRHVRIDSRGETSVKSLFAVGDLTMRPDEPVMKQIYTAQEYAVRAVDTIDRRRRALARKKILGE